MRSSLASATAASTPARYRDSPTIVGSPPWSLTPPPGARQAPRGKSLRRRRPTVVAASLRTPRDGGAVHATSCASRVTSSLPRMSVASARGVDASVREVAPHAGAVSTSLANVISGFPAPTERTTSTRTAISYCALIACATAPRPFASVLASAPGHPCPTPSVPTWPHRLPMRCQALEVDHPDRISRDPHCPTADMARQRISSGT